MKKRWLLCGVLAVAASSAASSLASPGEGASEPTKLGPYAVVTDDHGSCGNVWAVDTEKRWFSVRPKRDGSYTLTRFGRGTFVTKAGRSPGACEKARPHGSRIAAGVRGTLHGYVRGRITGGTFRPDATCSADCGFTDVWIATFFGPNANFSCFGNSRACQFSLEYHAARGQHLRFRNWYDGGHGAGSLLHERFRGDVART